MTTLITITSLTLNVCLVGVAIVLYKKLTNTVKTRENQLIEVNKHINRMLTFYEPRKRTIEGRIALGVQDIGPRYLADLRKSSGLSRPLIEYVIKQVTRQIVLGIEMELNYNPQYIKITSKVENDDVFVDFSFPFILYPGRENMIDQLSQVVKNAPDHFTKPPIINKHF